MDYTELRKLLANTEFLTDITNKTSFLGPEKTIPIRQRLWHIDNEIYSIPFCKTCQEKHVKWSKHTSEYRPYCSSKCSHNNIDVKKKTEKTCMERYGAKTNLLNKDNIQKQKTTCMERYGVENISKSEYFKEAYQNTCMERYGVSNVSKLESTKEKIDITHEQRYGRKRQSQSHITDDVLLLKNDEDTMRHWFFDLKLTVMEIAQKLGVNHSQLCLHFKNNLGIDIARHNVSSIERQIGEFLDSLEIPYHTSDRTILKPKELDIVINSLNLAIEINGLVWHGENMGKDKQYHLSKMTDCKYKGIRLIQITDEEWTTKQEIVKSRLTGILGKNTKIWARKCKVKELDTSTVINFFQTTHIQGYCVSRVAYGLFYNDELVAAMTFCKSRYNKKYEWELLRYSNKLYTNVIGGASKLLSHFEKQNNPKSIISYCDLRWNTGTVYEKIGFTRLSQSSPNYWYTKNGRTTESRVKYQKHKLSKLLDQYDSSLTEWENMKNNGYDRIWDCGNLVFVKEKGG